MSRLSVKGVQVLLIVALCAAYGWGQAAEPRASVKGYYLLVWAGDRAKMGNDFLAVIDADYGLVSRIIKRREELVA